jgi:hypothetical protein
VAVFFTDPFSIACNQQLYQLSLVERSSIAMKIERLCGRSNRKNYIELTSTIV